MALRELKSMSEKNRNLQITYASLSDVGCVRTNNEDAVIVDAQRRIAVLADGMGGYNAGEVASDMAVRQTLEGLVQWFGDIPPEKLTAREIGRAMIECVDNTNRNIFESSYSHQEYAGMGTTIVVAVVHQTTLLLGHVGDSRAYRLREGKLEQMTCDHSLLQEQVHMGLLTAKEAEHALHKNLVTRALGVEDTVLLDLQEIEIEPGDVYMMCSDGLNDMLPDEEIAAVMSSSEDPDIIAKALVQGAKDHGGGDNVSVIVFRVQDAGGGGALGKLMGRIKH